MATLKRQNRLSLVAALVGNLTLFGVLARRGTLLWALRYDRSELQKLFPVGVAVLLTGVLNSQLPADLKARIVFLRWNDPLPGSRAFSHYLASDPRINAASLTKQFGPFPQSPPEQNALWYALYRSVESEAAVRETHQQYLLSRDYATLTLLLAVVMVPTAIVVFTSYANFAGFVTLLGVQFTLAARAARVHAERLICTVLAIKSAEGGRS